VDSPLVFFQRLKFFMYDWQKCFKEHSKILQKILFYTVVSLCLLFNQRVTHDGIRPLTALGIIAAWMMLDLFSTLSSKKTSAIRILQKGLFCFILVALILVPLKNRMIQKNGYNYKLTHDGLIQTEYALELLSKGRNIYSEDVPIGLYANDTYLTFEEKGGEKVRIINPAHYHYIYPPLFTLESFPLYTLMINTLNWFDQRVVLLGYLIFLIIFLFKLPFDDDTKYLSLFLFVLNPFFLKFFLEGRNDLVVYCWIMLSFIFLQKTKTKLAILSICIACLMKQTGWFCVPFVYLYLYHFWKPQSLRVFFQKALLESLPSLLLSIIIMLPFIIWDFHGLWSDMILYPAGKLSTSYPVNGYSLVALLIHGGYLGSIFDYYPVSWIQIPVYSLIFIWTHFRLKKSCDISICLFQMSLALFSFWFLSRFYHDNYIEFTVRLFLLAWLFKKIVQKEESFDKVVPV